MGKKVFHIKDDEYLVFDEETKETSVLDKAEIESVITSNQALVKKLDVYKNKAALLAWANENFYLHGDGETVRVLETEIARMQKLLELLP